MEGRVEGGSRFEWWGGSRAEWPLRVQPCHITQGSALPHHSGFSSATSLTLGDRDVKVQVWLPLQADLQRPDQGDPLGQGAEGHHHTRVKLQLQGMVG